jgi:hypothetical protein
MFEKIQELAKKTEKGLLTINAGSENFLSQLLDLT